MQRLVLLLSATVLTFITLYIPQPLQPQLAELYGRSTAQGGALTTVALAPLAIAPIFYGYLLGGMHPAHLLRFALIGLGLSNIAFASIHGFHWLLGVRFIQGALIPIVITAIISLLLHNNPRVQKTLSLYVAFTIIGGFLGRFFAGLFDTYFYWQVLPWLIAALLIAIAFMLPKPTIDQSSSSYQRPHLSDLINLLKQRSVLTYYLVIFAVFSCFVGLLNYLPFILKKAFPDSSSLTAGLMYSGYITGAIVAVFAERIVRHFGVRQSLANAIILFTLSIGVLWLKNITLTFIVLFLFCAALFLLHTVAIAEVNKHSRYDKGLTNAFYTAFYYAGGVYGSFIPGLVYQHYGLSAFLIMLMVTAAFGLIGILSLTGTPSDQ
ncbi:MFS transporter [Suttonella sp. R2A3]|uniref:MFS transporter n=1 Tax=Suttonella sp. R2A3 TaxID=2908648 RepID=UPI001F3BC841|nr:MFS transporter [Suttonella sp. R2A3]UJF24202.1 MFS transporter [Suttonella sp. R2A3]